MIIVLLGTRAQLIKIAPMLRELQRRGLPFKLLYTGQHKETMKELAADFSIPPPEHYVYGGREVTGVIHMGYWFVYCLARLLFNRSKYFSAHPSAADVIVVHGDTVSTLLGALVGRLLGMTVAHVEAGLRSFNIFHPFPEELTRLAVFRLTHIAFCPGDWSYENMECFKAERINTRANTLLDSLHTALQTSSRGSEIQPGSYGICSIHRFENIFSRRRLTLIVGSIEEAARDFPVLFVLHPATRIRLQKFELLERLERHPRIKLEKRMGYVEFVQRLRFARFVVTDGGGNQEELSYLGIPTLLMRKATERREGLGKATVVSGYDKSVIREFFDRVKISINSQGDAMSRDYFPSGIIVDRLAVYA